MNAARVKSLVEEARTLADEEVWDRAFLKLTDACALDPVNPVVLGALGEFLVRTGKFDEAAAFLEKGVSHNPLSADLRALLGIAYHLQRRNPAAEASLRESLRFEPGHPLAAKILVILLAGEKRHAEAREALRAAIELSGDDAELVVMDGAYREFAGETEGAKESFEHALGIDPENAQAAGGLRRLSSNRNAPPGGRRVVMLVEDRRIDRRVLDEARSLQHAGWSVTVIAGEPPEAHPYWDEECYADVGIVRVRQRNRLAVAWSGKSSVISLGLVDFPVDPAALHRHQEAVLPGNEAKRWFAARLDFFMEALQRPAEVYVAHDLPMLPAAAMAARVAGALLVYDSHELYPDQFEDAVLTEKLRSLESGLVPHADLVITVNESLAKIIGERYGVSPGVILNCPSFDAALLPVPRGNALREAAGIPADMRILLYQGGLTLKYRNLELLVPAMGMVRTPDVALVLMGPDAGGCKAALSAMARKDGTLGKRVFFLDAVKQTELLRYTASADAGIIPYPAMDLLNQYYCTPNKTFEFLVAGLPILANTLPELERFVSAQGVGINMPMRTAGEIAVAIDAFFAEETGAFRARLNELSASYVWETQGRKVVRLYEEMIKREAKAMCHRQRMCVND